MFVDIPETLAADPWFKTVGMLEHNWAVIVPRDENVLIVFFDDRRGVFDEMQFESIRLAENALASNGFAKYLDDIGTQEFVSLPEGQFEEREHPSGRIYSSGRYWRHVSMPRRVRVERVDDLEDERASDIACAGEDQSQEELWAYINGEDLPTVDLKARAATFSPEKIEQLTDSYMFEHRWQFCLHHFVYGAFGDPPISFETFEYHGITGDEVSKGWGAALSTGSWPGRVLARIICCYWSLWAGIECGNFPGRYSDVLEDIRSNTSKAGFMDALTRQIDTAYRSTYPDSSRDKIREGIASGEIDPFSV